MSRRNINGRLVVRLLYTTSPHYTLTHSTALSHTLSLFTTTYHILPHTTICNYTPSHSQNSITPQRTPSHFTTLYHTLLHPTMPYHTRSHSTTLFTLNHTAPHLYTHHTDRKKNQRIIKKQIVVRPWPPTGSFLLPVKANRVFLCVISFTLL